MEHSDEVPVNGYSRRFDQALRCASQWHRTQTWRGKKAPYINHLMAVAALIGTNGGSEAQVIAGLLHDAIENCDEAIPDIIEQIEVLFGKEVLAIVEGCMDARETWEMPWEKRKEKQLTYLRALLDDSPVLLVSLADHVDNSRSIVADLFLQGDELWSRVNGGRSGTIWYYYELAQIFDKKRPSYLSSELLFLVNLMRKQGSVFEGLDRKARDNRLLTKFLSRELDDLIILDGVHSIVIDSPRLGDFLAFVDPVNLTLNARVHILPSSLLSEEMLGTQKAAQFYEQAKAILAEEHRYWSSNGFHAHGKPELRLPSSRFGVETIWCSQLISRPCESMEDLVLAIRWLDERAEALCVRAD